MAGTSSGSTQLSHGDSDRVAVDSRTHLDGSMLSPAALWLIGCGTIGGVLFALTYVVEGATRTGYNGWQQAISVLSLGPGGWVQQASFIIFGILAVMSAFGWRIALNPGAGSMWYPILKAITGLGLIVDGIFSQDPVIGYPIGTATIGAPTTHGVIHNLFAYVTITSIVIGCFVLAYRFAKEPRWRGWVAYVVLTGLLTMVFIATFGALNGHAGAPAGLFEKLATGINTLLSLAILVRLLLDRRRFAHE